MATDEERLRVLKMIQSGKISPEEGSQLLDALEGRKSEAAGDFAAETSPTGGKQGPRWFHLKVTDTDNGKPRVDLRIPVGLVTAGIKFGARFTPEIQGLDMNEIIRWVNAGETGQVMDVIDDDDGERVQVSLE